MRIQMTGVATAPLSSGFFRDDWTQQGEGPILYPELPWEGECIEASALCRHSGKFYMFYGGAYNNAPQQIGCAVSLNGIHWRRVSDRPVLPNGKAGEWNSSESGHPYVLEATDGTYHLFFQGNNDHGQTWYLSRKKISGRMEFHISNRTGAATSSLPPYLRSSSMTTVLWLSDDLALQPDIERAVSFAHAELRIATRVQDLPPRQ